MSEIRELRPLKINDERKQKPYLVIDIESIKWTQFLCIGCYDGRNFLWWDNIGDCLSYLFADHNGYDIFAHFGGRFDFLFILKEILGDSKIKLGPIIPRGSGILYFECKYRSSILNFRDSSALLPFSLKRLTQNFQVEHKKQEIDYDKISKITPKLIEYLEYDCRGLYESIQKFYEWPIIKRSGGSYTIAGQALRVLRTYLEKPIVSLSKNLDKKIRSAYLGGRVEIFQPVFNSSKNKLFCYDVNSLYPTVMFENPFPNRFIYETYEYEKNSLGFYEVKVKAPKGTYIPCLGIERDGTYIFPTGDFSGTFTISEINYAKTMGYKIEVERGYIFDNAGYLFRDFVSELYKIKETSRTDSVDYTIAKLLLNSCYGRFGLNSQKENIVIDDGSAGLTELGIEFKIKGYTMRLMKKGVKLETFSNVAIAAYVTSYARIYMHRLYLAQGPEHLYYTDTDSLFTSKRNNTGSNLGELKLESECKSACFLLPKTYVAGDKIVMKGFDKKKIQHFTYDDFMACLEGDLKRLKIIQEPKFATLKTALRSGELVTMTKKSTRQIRSTYDKRVIIKKNGAYHSVPIHLGD